MTEPAGTSEGERRSSGCNSIVQEVASMFAKFIADTTAAAALALPAASGHERRA